MNRGEGFLVVLRSPEEVLRSRNPHYRGIDRLPPYPPANDDDQEALDEYVFGHYKNDEGLIPELAQAKELLSKFARSRQEFEIIYVADHEPGMNLQSGQFLGFDVAGQSPFWSIVGDLPPDPTSRVFADTLNKHGLFDSKEDARRYLETYRSRWQEDPDLVLRIWEVHLVDLR